MTNQQDSWPAGATWIFQGTVAEDATGGTHVCTLTVTPGAGNEIQLLNGSITGGATATAQVYTATITDGTNLLDVFVSISDTTTGAIHAFPSNSNTTGTTVHNGLPGPIISGPMQLILKVSTAAISVTQTFAVTCRIKGAMPTAVLLDTVGTSTNTVNTNKVF